jgi:hypothetical protein
MAYGHILTTPASRHFDLIGGGGHPWSVDLVAITAAGIPVLGFVLCPRSPVGPLRINRDARDAPRWSLSAKRWSLAAKPNTR